MRALTHTLSLSPSFSLSHCVLDEFRASNETHKAQKSNKKATNNQKVYLRLGLLHLIEKHHVLTLQGADVVPALLEIVLQREGMTEKQEL